MSGPRPTAPTTPAVLQATRSQKEGRAVMSKSVARNSKAQYTIRVGMENFGQTVLAEESLPLERRRRVNRVQMSITKMLPVTGVEFTAHPAASGK